MTALVNDGFFHDTEPDPVRRGDNRLVRTRAVIERSTADFVDIHPYADDELMFLQFMQNYSIDGPVAPRRAPHHPRASHRSAGR